MPLLAVVSATHHFLCHGIGFPAIEAPLSCKAVNVTNPIWCTKKDLLNTSIHNLSFISHSVASLLGTPIHSSKFTMVVSTNIVANAKIKRDE